MGNSYCLWTACVVLCILLAHLLTPAVASAVSDAAAVVVVVDVRNHWQGVLFVECWG